MVPLPAPSRCVVDSELRLDWTPWTIRSNLRSWDGSHSKSSRGTPKKSASSQTAVCEHSVIGAKVPTREDKKNSGDSDT
jgi:hypothetical protein